MALAVPVTYRPPPLARGGDQGCNVVRPAVVPRAVTLRRKTPTGAVLRVHVRVDRTAQNAPATHRRATLMSAVS
jgi:hypothetical protein